MIFFVSDHLTKLNINYHVIVNQLSNNLNPTRHLRIKFLANSRRIKNATEQLDLGLISTWQFLQRSLYLSSSYELRQRQWALRNPDLLDEDPLAAENAVPIEIPLEVAEVPLPVQHDVPVLGIHDQPVVEQRDRVCMVCMVVTVNNSAAQYIVIPCGHAWVCDTCIIQLERQNSDCPLCRTNEISFQRIFFT